MAINSSVYDPRLEQLFGAEASQAHGVEARLSRVFRRIFPNIAFTPEIESGAVDRTDFYATKDELLEVGFAQGVVVVEDDPDFVHTEARGVIKALESDELPLNKRVKLERRVLRAKDQHVMDIVEARAWWTIYENKKYYTRNIFASDPTEQIVIHGQENEVPVSVLNFGHALQNWQIQDIVATVNIMSQSTRGAIRSLVPNIVIHDAFTPSYFAHTNSYDVPAGQAWGGKPFIELNRASIDGGRRGSKNQSWLSQIIAHEMKHQIDAFYEPRRAAFTEYFRYYDDDGDKIIDRVVPLATHMWHGHSDDAVAASRPHRDYGYVNAKEDLAVTSEEAVFGGKADPLRRDAYLEILQKFVCAYFDRSQQDVPLGVDFASIVPFAIERRKGSSIELPRIPELSREQRVQIMATAGLLDLFRR